MSANTVSQTAAVSDDLADRAVSLVDQYLHDEALDLISKSLESHQGPVPAAVQIARARALSGLERYRVAHDLLRPLLEDEHASPLERAEMRQILARILVRTWGDLDVAIDMAREAARIAARSHEEGRRVLLHARGAAAMGFTRKRCRDTALREIDEARSIVGQDPILVAFEAAIVLDFDSRVAARDLYRRCTEMGEEGRRWGNIGLAHVALLAGEFADGHRYLDALGSLGRCDLPPRWERARLFVAEDRWAEAAEAFAAVHAASPLGEGARFARLQRASCLYHAERRDEAVAAYDALAAESVDDRAANDARRMARLLKAPDAASKKKARLREFPSVAQLRDHCGPASCELYLRYFGIPADQVEIARQIKLPGGGTPVYAMRKFLEGAGLEVRRIEADLPTLKKVIDIGLPLILEEEYSTSRHVAVAVGYDDEREIVEVQDPMTHEVRETPYETLPRLLAMANHGALIGVPRGDGAKLEALDAAGIREARYISLVDEAWEHFDREEYDAAAKLCDESMALRRDYELLWICKFQLARKAHERDAHPERRAEMQRILDEMLALWPDDEWPQQYVGYTLYHEGRYEEALHAFEKARDRDDADGNNWAMIGDCLIAMGRRDAAVRPLQEALARFPSHVRSNENLADLLESRGELGRAWVLSDAAREIHPSNPFNHEVHARLHERRGNLVGALAAYEEAVKAAYSGRLWPYFQRARTLAKLGRVDEAVQSLQPLIEKSPNDVGIKVELADLLYAHGRPERAMAVCQEILERDRNNASGHAIHGAALAASGKIEEGLQGMRTALSVRPAYAWVHSEMGKHLQKAGRHLEAVTAFAAAVGLNQSANNRFFLGSALADAGAGRDAAGQLRWAADTGALDEEKLVRCAQVVSQAESFGCANDFLASMVQARKGDMAPVKAQIRLLLEEADYPRAARPLLETLVEAEPEHPYALMHRGKTLADENLASEAKGESLLRSSLELMPGSRAARLALAEVHCERGRHEQVLELLRDLPPLLRVQKLRVEALLGLGKVQEAFDLANEQEVESSNRAESWELKYMVAQHVREYTPALDFVEKLSHAGGEMEDDAQLDRWEVEKFRCLVQLGETDRAESFGQKQVGEAGDASYLAHTALSEERPDLARLFCDRALSMDPQDPLGLAVMARVDELAGNVDLARSRLEKVAALDAEDHSSRENLARLSLSFGDLESAARLSEDAVRLGHLCPWAFAVRAQVRVVRGDRAGALTDIERAWSLASPHDRERGAEDVWAVLAALRDDREELAKLRRAWADSKAPRSKADEDRFARVMQALGS